jgi:hypothetical protein
MKIDHDYLKKLLQACQASDNPTFDIADLQRAGFDYNDRQFEFHMGILADQGFVERDDGDLGFGISKSADGHASWSILSLRLTASGHQFAEALCDNRVWSAIKHGFKDASIATLRTVALKLLEGYTQDHISHLLRRSLVCRRHKGFPIIVTFAR